MSFVGSGWMLLGLLPAFAIRSLRAPSLAALATLGVTSGLVTILKATTKRVRPCHALEWAHALAIECPTDGSFPSGHAAGTFAFALFVCGFKPRAAFVLIPIACLIALTRVALGVHYPSDILGGAVLGSTIGWTSAWAYRSLNRSLDGRPATPE